MLGKRRARRAASSTRFALTHRETSHAEIEKRRACHFEVDAALFHFDQIANDLRMQSPFVRADDMKVLHQLVIGEI